MSSIAMVPPDDDDVRDDVNHEPIAAEPEAEPPRDRLNISREREVVTTTIAEDRPAVIERLTRTMQHLLRHWAGHILHLLGVIAGLKEQIDALNINLASMKVDWLRVVGLLFASVALAAVSVPVEMLALANMMAGLTPTTRVVVAVCWAAVIALLAHVVTFEGPPLFFKPRREAVFYGKIALHAGAVSGAVAILSLIAVYAIRIIPSDSDVLAAARVWLWTALTLAVLSAPICSGCLTAACHHFAGGTIWQRIVLRSKRRALQKNQRKLERATGRRDELDAFLRQLPRL